MLRKIYHNNFFRFALWLLVVFTYSFAISNILDPNKLAPGGVTGISIILNRFIPLQVGTLVFIINIPILVIGAIKFGIKPMFATFITLTLSSTLMDFLSPYGPVITDPLLCCVFGGALYSASLGIIFKLGATTGGSDIIVKLLKTKFPHIETGKLFLFLDAVIVTISAIAFKNLTTALYAGITIFVSSIVLDKVLYGTDGAKLLFIISDHSDEITAEFLKSLSAGVTYLNGHGAYDNTEKLVMMCAMKKTLLPKARDIVRNIDDNAFMIIGNANEILGLGFKSHHASLL